MTDSTALPPRPLRTAQVQLAASADFGLVELRGRSPLVAQLLPTGALFAFRHGPTLINQFLPGPAEEGLFRLLLRWRGPAPSPRSHLPGPPAPASLAQWARLVGPGLDFRRTGPASALWKTIPAPGLECETELHVHPEKPAWTWRVRVRNTSSTPLTFDVLHAQDLGLGDEAAVRNNEAYTSQYIDLLPLRDDVLGWTLLARQNQAMAEGRRPWLACACAERADEFCTDGTQFFGADHRLAGVPEAVRAAALPSHRLQYEFALAGLQSRLIGLVPGETRQVVFVADFVDDHPAASGPEDLARLRELVSEAARGAFVRGPGDESVSLAAEKGQTSLFIRSGWLHGEAPAEPDWNRWFPGARRHEERAPDGALLGFFQHGDTHVIARDKEAAIARPHGHILRSGDGRWFDAGHFGITCYASGIFSAQAYLGHPSFARLLSVVRNALNVPRASGQRILVRREGQWFQLGVPSAFAMSPGDARWLYKFDDQVIEARVSCAASLPASRLELRVLRGRPCEFLLSHEVVLGASEYEHAIGLDLHADLGWVGCRPSPASLVGQYQPDVCFAIAAEESSRFVHLGGDGPLYADARSRDGPYVVLQSKAVMECGVLLIGGVNGLEALAGAVEAARALFTTAGEPARPLPAPVRLRRAGDAAVSRVDDILPWFAHNASIHFSAPHGLEQYGGAAWGVRDVCQGSVEWLLASGEFAVVRRLLEVVFAQQYEPDGSWPQWFMFPPYRFIQQAHSHGDVCFWPVKALCDYVEASNDFAFLTSRLGYMDPQRFVPCGPSETLLEHCDRVVAQCEARFLIGTALVNYGDGDWDDTLQPADPAMRTRMVSAWTVGLAFHAFRQLAEVCRRAGEGERAARLSALGVRMRGDFAARLMPRGIVAGFLVTNPDGSTRPLLHPDDAITHIRYRLLPMTRSILAELFTPDEARRHLAIIATELSYPDGVRLMSEPSTYQGGCERLFKRAETAANVGREIGLQYVHAHLRYAEALAKVGDAKKLWAALQEVNPVDLRAVVPNAAPRQSNMYFSSSDADFADRYEAAARWSELRTGKVPVRGGWRLYSSGPGLFLHKIRACLLGLRETFDDIVFDPVLPHELDGLVAEAILLGHRVDLRFQVRNGLFSPEAVTVNGTRCRSDHREANPYRRGGLAVARAELEPLLSAGINVIEIEL